MLSPPCMWSKARLISSSRSVWVIISSTLMRPLMYQSTYCGNWVRPRVPPKAVPRQARPVTSRNGRAWISSPAPATPMMIACPQPLCAEASACPITSTSPMHSKEKSTPPRVISTTASATLGTVAGSRTSVAPSCRAMANFGGFGSRPMMRPPPARTAPWITESPTPPGAKARHTGPDLLDHAATFVAEHGREQAGRVAPAHGVGVGVADAGRDQADQALAGARALEVDLVDHERLARLPADGGADLHGNR